MDVPQSCGAVVLSCSVVDPPPAGIVAESKVQADSLGRFVQLSFTGRLKPFAGETFTITLAICPTVTVKGAALIAKLDEDAACDEETTSATAAETLPFIVASPA